MFIPRFYDQLSEFMYKNKVLMICGPRQAGKTTLVKHFLEGGQYRARFETGDNLATSQILSSMDLARLTEYVAGFNLLVIDEAQRIPNIGLSLKLLVDHVPGLQLIATGSSSFELAGQTSESLTGRKITLTLYPVSQLELSRLYNPHDLKAQLEKFLIYGSYPEILTASTDQEKAKLISEMAHSYLLKDVLELERIKSAKTLLDLLKLLAFQVGNLVSLSELATTLGIDSKTVGRYLDLLEKSFVIYQLRGFSRNLRNEISKKSKYYFYDTGMRNAIIANFNSLSLRDDVGALWENWLVMERIKRQHYLGEPTNYYFWRTWQHHEIDLIEERGGKLYAYEFKFSPAAKAKPASEWLEAYQGAEFSVINQANYLKFLTKG